ncbi:MAG: hypothetical protein ACM37W_18940 [Actinomycetota bacterium]
MRFAGKLTNPSQRQRRFWSSTSAILVLFVNLLVGKQPVQAETLAYCKLSPDAIAQKETLRQAALTGKPEAVQAYFNILGEHARQIGECRRRTWPQTQGIWLRLYPCDARPGEIDRVLDQVVNKGYNQVYVEAFYNGQVLLPVADNPTVWPSVLRNPGYEKFDLLAKAINKGRQRGLKVYAWLFTMNFGYTYSQRPDRQQALARNGKGQTTLTVTQNGNFEDQVGDSQANHAFIDPYNPQARQDYYQMLNAVLKRRPQGMLFDYVRYMRGSGADSVADQVQDLWIYGESSQQVLLQRAQNQKGRDLIQRYLSQGFIKSGDVQAVNKLYPGEREPLWQGKKPTPVMPMAPATTGKDGGMEVAVNPLQGKQQIPTVPPPIIPNPETLQRELWQLTVGHAVQGILDFLGLAIQPAQRLGIPTGAVFFPYANKPVNEGGYDSRLQPWDRFPASMEFHAMSYGNCGDMSCILPQVQRVVSLAPQGVKIIPALAGDWGKPLNNRPSLEAQMQAIHSQFPQINAMSHFSYGWQEPEDERDRQSCRL